MSSVRSHSYLQQYSRTLIPLSFSSASVLVSVSLFSCLNFSSAASSLVKNRPRHLILSNFKIKTEIKKRNNTLKIHANGIIIKKVQVKVYTNINTIFHSKKGRFYFNFQISFYFKQELWCCHVELKKVRKSRFTSRSIGPYESFIN